MTHLAVVRLLVAVALVAVAALAGGAAALNPFNLLSGVKSTVTGVYAKHRDSSKMKLPFERSYRPSVRRAEGRLFSDPDSIERQVAISRHLPSVYSYTSPWGKSGARDRRPGPPPHSQTRPHLPNLTPYLRDSAWSRGLFRSPPDSMRPTVRGGTPEWPLAWQTALDDWQRRGYRRLGDPRNSPFAVASVARPPIDYGAHAFRGSHAAVRAGPHEALRRRAPPSVRSGSVSHPFVSGGAPARVAVQPRWVSPYDPRGTMHLSFGMPPSAVARQFEEPPPRWEARPSAGGFRNLAHDVYGDPPAHRNDDRTEDPVQFLELAAARGAPRSPAADDADDGEAAVRIGPGTNPHARTRTRAAATALEDRRGLRATPQARPELFAAVGPLRYRAQWSASDPNGQEFSAAPGWWPARTRAHYTYEQLQEAQARFPALALFDRDQGARPEFTDIHSPSRRGEDLDPATLARASRFLPNEFLHNHALPGGPLGVDMARQLVGTNVAPPGSVFNKVPRAMIGYDFPGDPYRLVRLVANGVANLRPESDLPLKGMSDADLQRDAELRSNSLARPGAPADDNVEEALAAAEQAESPEAITSTATRAPGLMARM